MSVCTRSIRACVRKGLAGGVLAAVIGGWLTMTVSGPLRAQSGASPAQAPVDFVRHIEPIFKDQCYSCHGSEQQMSGLRLDDAEAALKGGYSGPAIVAGDSANSTLIKVLSGGSKVAMPMGGDPLPQEQVGLLRAWIDQGAKRPAALPAPLVPAVAPDSVAGKVEKSTHWAFRPIESVTAPSVRDAAWVRNPIDAFVSARLDVEGIKPTGEADRTTLIRRLSLDLIGLPPTPQEVAAFVSNNRPDAYERLVDRLLQSPHYGEKWGRHWLDLARYADSDGYRRDEFRPNAWRYRHWVIEALNRDMPFDQFTIEQIAGDLLPGATAEQRVATGFHRNTMANRESGIDNEQTRVEQVVDRTNAVSTVWLGLTAGCAQCHDHKYDPLKQKEYYELLAFFDNVEEIDIDAPLPGEIGPYSNAVVDYRNARHALLQEYRVPELMLAWEKGLLEAAANPGQKLDWDNALTELKSSEAQPVYNQGEKILRTDPSKRSEKQQRLLLNHFLVNYRRVITQEENQRLKFSELRKQLDTLDAAFPALSEAQAITVEAEPRETYIHLRGDFRARGIKVQPGTPAFLPPMRPGDSSPTRLSLAQWIVSGDNPLTPRVTVNRLWQELFGRGISLTSENFGLQGQKPTHPELLDWLAADFIASGWSWKHTIKRIVMSATYRQSSAAAPALTVRDPDNTLLARQRRFRLSAELIRDSALAASGLLYPAVGGRSIRPPLPDIAATSKRRPGEQAPSAWRESTGPDRYRRGLYIQSQRISPYPMLANFDMPSSYASICRREASISPLQALNLLNDPVFFEAAQALARRVLTDLPSGTFADRLEYAFRLTLVRAPDADERALLTDAFDRQRRIIEKSPGGSQAAAAAEPFGVDRVEGAAWVGLSSILLNLDEFITRD